jgi:hypothetical protein
MPAPVVEPELPKSTAPFADCKGAPLRDGFAALPPRFNCNARDVPFGGAPPASAAGPG